ncbi:MarR family winged helix-turn-helix transcriptional regulator [Peterkaempfera bronchialis]|uniref:MarR family winged helix-turn-helix transcriptional regulator n=1 Tax=Peterkaempfera bronchialis TaxID=2126346 RepID=UPI003C2C2E54
MTEQQQAPATQAAPPGSPDAVVTRLRGAALRLAYGLRIPAAEHGLTPTRLAALVALAAHGPLRVGDLARRLGTSAPSVSRLLDILVDADLVARRADPVDQRAALLVLTPGGTAVLDAVCRESLDRLTAPVTALPADDLARLAAALPVLESLADSLAPGSLPDADRPA